MSPRRDGRARLGQLRHHPRHRRRLRRSPQLRHGGGRPAAGGAGLPRRHHRPAGLASAPSRSRRWAGRNLFFGVTAGNMDSMVNRYTADRKIAPRRRLHARTARAASARTARCIVYAQRCREAYQGRAGRHRRHRGQPAPHRPLRLLVGQGAPLDPGRRQGRPAALRQRRARRSSRSPTAWPPARAIASIPISAARPSCARGAADGWCEIDSTRSIRRAGRRASGSLCHGRDSRRLRHAAKPRSPTPAPIRQCATSARPRAAGARAHRHPPAVLRAGEGGPGALCPRLARAAPGDQSRQRAGAGAAPRRPRRLAESAADPADHAEMDARLRPALCARAASGLRRRARSRPGR